MLIFVCKKTWVNVTVLFKNDPLFYPPICLDMVVVITGWETAKEYSEVGVGVAYGKTGQIMRNCPSGRE